MVTISLWTLCFGKHLIHFFTGVSILLHLIAGIVPSQQERSGDICGALQKSWPRSHCWFSGNLWRMSSGCYCCNKIHVVDFFFFFTYATSWCIKHCFWFLFGQETQRNYQVKVELKKHVTEMMKDEEPPKEVDKLYQYFEPKCEIAFQMFWKQTYDNFVSDDICI